MARMEWIELDSTPANESCQQIGKDYSVELARLEASLYAKQIREQFPNYDKVTIMVKTYYSSWTRFEVAVGFNPADCESIRQAFDIESMVYANWTDESKKELEEIIDTIKFNNEAAYSDRI